MTADPARAAAIYLWLVSALVSWGPPIGATGIWLAWQRIRPAGGPVPGMPRITATLAGLAVKAAAHARKVPVNSRQALQRASTVPDPVAGADHDHGLSAGQRRCNERGLDPIATAIRSPVRPHRIERPRNPNPGPGHRTTAHSLENRRPGQETAKSRSITPLDLGTAPADSLFQPTAYFW